MKNKVQFCEQLCLLYGICARVHVCVCVCVCVRACIHACVCKVIGSNFLMVRQI